MAMESVTSSSSLKPTPIPGTDAMMTRKGRIVFFNKFVRYAVIPVSLGILLAATWIRAEISEPDFLIYGSASVYGEPVHAGSLIQLVLQGDSEPVAAYVMGSKPAIGDLFLLRIPLDAIGQRPGAHARTGDAGVIFIDGEPAGQVVIGERGTVKKMDVDPEEIEATPSLVIDDVRVEEGDSGTTALVFTVSLSPLSEDEVTAQWITSDGTAAGASSCGSGADFMADSGLITISPGDAGAQITILACGEDVIESDEDFFVDLLNPTNAVLLDPQGRGTILDDDTPPGLSVNNITVTEPESGSRTALFRVSLTRLWDSNVSFSYQTSNGSAEAGTDYLAVSGTSTIPAGSLETTIEVDVLADTLNEDDETFFLNLADPVNASILDGEGQAILVDSAQFLTWLEAHFDGTASVEGLAGAYSSAVSPDGRHLYAVGSADNAVAVFERDSTTGHLSFLFAYTPDDFTGRARSTFVGLGGAADVVLSSDGNFVYVAAFSDDAVTVFSRDASDGTLALVEVEINGVNDLSDPGGTVTGLDGPTALALSPTGSGGEHLYAAGYHSSSIAVFSRNPGNGKLSFLESETDGVDDPGDLGGTVDGLHLVSDLVVSPDGGTVYAVGQGDDAVAVFERDTDSLSGTEGRLSFLEVQKDGAAGVDGLDGATSVAIASDGSHLYVAGQNDNAVAVFSRRSDGRLDWIGEIRQGDRQVDGLLGASAVAISRDDGYIYACGYLGNSLAVFRRNTDAGSADFGLLEYIEVKKDGVGGVDGLFRPTSVVVSPGDDNVYVSAYSDNAVAVFHRDLTAPSPPVLTSTSHQLSQWSNNPVIAMEWSGAADDPGGSGVAGYSVVFDSLELTDPGEEIDIHHTVDPHSFSSGTLPDGIDHYFHLRVCDHSDNCSDPQHAGPYWIDTAAPNAVEVTGSSHEVGIPSYDATIQMWWNDPPGDPGEHPSGVAGYSYTFNDEQEGQCNFEIDVPVGTATVTSRELPAGEWYFHICAVDEAGNWSTPSTSGPYEILNDGVPPKITMVSSVSTPASRRQGLGNSERHGITQLILKFSKEMFDPAAGEPHDVDDPGNYLLVSAGPDHLIQTTTCGVPAGDDMIVGVDGVQYNSAEKSAAVAAGAGRALPMDYYRFFACSGGLRDINGNDLDGDGDGSGGDDFSFTFLMERTNLPTNPNLDDADLAPEWALSDSRRITHSAEDAGNAATSGSIRVHRESGEGDDHEFSISQCIALPEWDGSDYYLSVRVRLDETLGGDPGAAGAFAGVTFFDAINCGGAMIGTEEQTDIVVDDTGGLWMPVSAELGAASPTARSALVSLTVQIPSGEDFPFDAFFDDVLFQYSDTAVPTDPSVHSTSHTENAWSADPDIEMSFSGAVDAGVGVEGYSYLFDNFSTTLPDDTIDQEHTGGVQTVSSGALADGRWYFHLRTCDRVGNCTSTVHKGWYGIDTVAPLNPTDIVSTSHEIGVESGDNIIAMQWTQAVDAPPAPSGVGGYAAFFDNVATATCPGVANLLPTATTFVGEPMVNGDWYFHICTVDNVGNWSAPSNIGPFVVADHAPPRVVLLDSVSSTRDGSIDQEDMVVRPLTQLLVGFSEPMRDPPGDSDPGDVTNPVNYRLVGAGVDTLLETTSCGAVQGDDILLPVDGLGWDAESHRTFLSFGEGLAIPNGWYRLFVCSSGALADIGGNELDGDGDGTGGDRFFRDFLIYGSNLLENPNFDLDLGGWTTIDEPPAFFAFEQLDCDGAPSSGSAVIHGVAGADRRVGLSQCIDLDSIERILSFCGRVMLQSNAGAEPSFHGWMTFYDGAGCEGTVLDEVVTGELEGDTAGQFVEIPRADIRWLPDMHSVRVRFIAWSPSDPDSDFDVAFDGLVFRISRKPLFEDDFESGDFSEWSMAIGGP